MRALFLLLITAFSLAFLAIPATAQDRPNTILVLDGSGSMWGQIDGVAKITIAQDVVTDLLQTLPADERLGLMAYGHRERGNCTDIETLVDPAEGTREAIAAAVAGIKPLGKTPMTDSVIAAAEALRYTEDSATVILISDGVETCNPDPCAAARLLEEAGIDFTAHVIGFDVSGDAEALTQMQCIADETGGQFLSASNATELGAALNTVVAEPEPVIVTGTFRATLGDANGPLLTDPVIWDLAGVLDGAQGNPVTAELTEGAYTVTAYRVVDEMTLEATFTVAGPSAVQVVIPFPEPEPTASLTAPDSVPGGSTFPVGWVGPDENLDTIRISPPGKRYFDFGYTDEGNPVQIIAPIEPGTYELSYWLRDSKQIATRAITVTEIPLGLDAPDAVPVASDFEVMWTGPDAKFDNIQIGTDDGRYSDFQYTERGNPVTLTAPTEPGTYVLRYKFLDRQEIFTRPIEVTQVLATIDAPATAVAGDTIDVAWTGPDYRNDYVGIGAVDADGSAAWQNFAYTRDGTPVELQVPITPGEHLIQYFLAEDRTILATRAITVTPVTASITAPAEAVAGSTIDVSWTGPDYRNDYIGIGAVDAKGSAVWDNFTYTRDGSTLELQMPTATGDYLIQYFAAQDRTILATHPITITDATASISAPAEAVAGSTISVSWTGPDYRNDYIGVGTVDADGSARWDNFTYTRDGDPLDLQLPTATGDYLIQYFVGQDRTVLATVPITITDITASITAPATAVAGSTIDVGWTGPDYQNDYIGVGTVDAENSERWDNFAYTRDGAKLELQLPTTPGDYLLTYFVGQDRAVLASVPITLTPVKAAITAPAEAVAGDTISVTWEGPDYQNDYIGIGLADANGSARWENFAYTRDGTPAELVVPTTPGDYAITYFVGQDRAQLFTTPITVTPVKAQLLAAPSGAAGSKLVIGWDGPDYRNDYIGIGAVDADGSNQWETFAYTRDGNPVEVTLPETPGDYVIRYFLGQDRSVIGQLPVTVE